MIIQYWEIMLKFWYVTYQEKQLVRVDVFARELFAELYITILRILKIRGWRLRMKANITMLKSLSNIFVLTRLHFCSVLMQTSVIFLKVLRSLASFIMRWKKVLKGSFVMFGLKRWTVINILKKLSLSKEKSSNVKVFFCKKWIIMQKQKVSQQKYHAKNLKTLNEQQRYQTKFNKIKLSQISPYFFFKLQMSFKVNFFIQKLHWR